MIFREFVNEAQMSNEEIVKACETLIENGDDEIKGFAEGLLKFYKENGSFTPAQVSGLQNIMKNASFQLAK